jgi:hypothetical protein
MNSTNLVNALKRKFKTTSLPELATILGVSGQMMTKWDASSATVKESQIALLLFKAQHAARERYVSDAIKPIVEFYPVNKVHTPQGTAFQIFDSNASKCAGGLRSKLDASHGVYIFYDSRGQSLYVGKARKQSLWKEMNNAFVRERVTQRIKLVPHTEQNRNFIPANEKQRQPKQTQLLLADLAYYCSAHEVEDRMINILEALMVRGFANDLLNKKMEKFS